MQMRAAVFQFVRPLRTRRSFANAAAEPSYACGTSAAPLLGLTIGQVLENTVRTHGNVPALIARNQKHGNLHSHGDRYALSYSELDDRVNKFAASLLKLGLEKGDR